MVVKGVKFRNHKVVGDIIDLASKYSRQGADEIVFYDITASPEGRRVNRSWVNEVAKQINIPFCVAGGIKSIVDAEEILNFGADKISINTPAINNPRLINALADKFGSQCVVVGIDSFQMNDQYNVYSYTGDPDKTKRATSVNNHKRWVEAAKHLGCHSIRVNASSGGSYEEQLKLAADGLGSLSEFAATHGLNVIVENHGGLSSNGAWLAGVMKSVNKKNCGTLPDFGNFRIGGGKTYDRYKGVRELMPVAKAVSAKSHDFDDKGNEIHTDYHKMMKIVIDAGYRGYVGVEYEGSKMSEFDGIKATKKLLETVRTKLA